MSHWQKRIDILRNRSFLLYSISSLLMMIGNGFTYVATSWLILEWHNNVAAVGILMFLFWTPNVLFGPLMGVVVDRYSRKWLMVFGNIVRMLSLFLFAFLMSEINSEVWIYALMLIAGVFFALGWPASVRFVREIVTKDDLLYANATVDMALELGNVIGMGAAGLVIAVTSAEVAMVVNGLLYILSTICLLMVRDKDIIEEKIIRKLTFIADFKAGLKYLVEEKHLIIIYTVQMILIVQYMTAPVLLAPFVKNILQQTVREFAFIDVGLSVGMIIGGVITPWLADQFGLMRTVVVNLVLLGVCFIWFSLNRNLELAIILYIIIGFCFAVWALLVTKAQQMTNLTYQGRVQACFNSLSGIIILGIYLFVSVSGQFVQLTDLYWLEGLMSAVGLLILAFLHRDGANPRV